MSLFDGNPLEAPNQPVGLVLSASRMTDMPKYYPEQIIAETEKRRAAGKTVHSLVLWTKHPRSLLAQPLQPYLATLKETAGIQLFVQLTITSLGQLTVGAKANGKPLILEPNAPPYRDSLAALPEIIGLTGKPDRIRLRIDPLVRIADSAGHTFSNLRYLPRIIAAAARHGISHFSFSFLEPVYGKVLRRFKNMGCTILPPTADERFQAAAWLKQLEQRYQVSIEACCVTGFPDSRCIDGRLLAQLHDQNQPADLSEARRRQHCGCTRSIDLGGWPPKPCFTGCAYCYARPVYVDE